MTQTHDTRVHKKRSESPVVTAVSVGGFFIVVGLVFAMNPGLIQSIGDFFTDLTLKATPFFGNSHFALPAPENPAAHETLYNAILQFDISIGILQVILLAFRLMLQSRTGRIAETVGDLVFWFGAAYLVSTFLLVGTLAAWFQYWAALIVVVGFSIIARGIVYLAKNH